MQDGDNIFNENHSNKRWYDKDPALQKALEQLRQSSDKYQAQIALNIIKIVVEHQSEANGHNPIEDSDTLLLQQENISGDQLTLKRRWYDVNETLHSAMQLLNDCPEDLQQSFLPSIVAMIEQSLNVNKF